MLLWCCLFLVFQLSSVDPHKNNVCKTFPDYSTIENNKNCWYNPDRNSSPILIAKRYGYPMKTYKVITEDGYILTLFRIPHNNTDIKKPRQPILLQHGIVASAVFWILQGQESLAFFLANNGYDVWLSTSRGETYSTQHIHLTIEDPLYWNFGFHELATNDLPAIIEAVANITGQKGNIIYIGHSMGTTTSYVYSIVKKNHSDSHLKALISLSPVAYLQNIQGLYKDLVPFVENIAMILNSLGIYSIGNHIPVVKEIVSRCGVYPAIIQCQILSSIVSGLVLEQVRPDLFPVFTSYFPGGTSITTIRHFAQLILSGGKFQYYDYGIGNIAIYNSFMPPSYDVTSISLPVYLFIARKDFIAPEEDVNILYEKLNSPQGKSKASKFYVNFAHNDFLFGRHVKEFYQMLLDVMKNKIGNK